MIIKAKKIHKILTAAVLSAAMLLISGLSAFAATAEEVRAAEQSIVDWKKNTLGIEEGPILSGDLLDRAGNGSSDWFAFDITRMGIEDSQTDYLARLHQYVENFYIHLDDNIRTVRVSDMHRVVLTIRALGGDPTSFGKDPEGNPIDLVKDTVWNSLWGDPGNQGVNGYIWALLAADSGNYEEPAGAEWTRETLLSSLLSWQHEDGGFGLVKADASDVDLTSMALTALGKYKDREEPVVLENEDEVIVREAADNAFAYLAAEQQDDGSILTYKSERTSESTSWAMMALCAWDRDPDTDEQFTKNGHTLLDGLGGFRLEDGGVIHSLDAEEPETAGSEMSAYQALYALEAVRRLKAGEESVFSMSEAPSVSEETIIKAAEELPEIKVVTEKDVEEARDDSASRQILLTAVIAAAVVIAVILFIILVLYGRKKNRNYRPDGDPGPADTEDDDDEDW